MPKPEVQSGKFSKTQECKIVILKVKSAIYSYNVEAGYQLIHERYQSPTSHKIQDTHEMQLI